MKQGSVGDQHRRRFSLTSVGTVRFVLVQELVLVLVLVLALVLVLVVTSNETGLAACGGNRSKPPVSNECSG